MKINWTELVIGGVIGAIIGVPVETAIHDGWEKWHWDERTLNSATEHRRLFTEWGFETAQKEYQSVLDKSSDQGSKIKALQGLSRTYSEWSIARFWRGLSQTSYADLGEARALDAEKQSKGDFETELALAYSYAARESGQKIKTATRQKVKELLIKRPDDPDLQFLAWIADRENNTTFPEKANSQKINNLIVLLSLANEFGSRAERDQDANARAKDVSRAQELLQVADQMAPGNEHVSFRRAYLAQQVTNEWDKALNYYDDAIKKEHEFPRAIDNRATILVWRGDYRAAEIAYQEIIHTEDAPLASRVYALNNLGELYLETDQKDEACRQFERAKGFGKIEVSAQMELLETVYSAVCKYLKHERRDARVTYLEAIEFSRRNHMNIDLTKLDTYTTKLRSGKKMVVIAAKLIELTRKKG